MNFQGTARRIVVTLCSLASLAVSTIPLVAQSPAVAKVEPPNWWVGHTINPVRLLVRGSNLGGASVEAPRGLHASHIKVSADGTYLFVDVEVSKKTHPGDYPLTAKTKAGSAEIPFRLDQPLPARGAFQGFSSDDIIYLLMPDRFANGDPSNDDPELSRGLFDRGKSRYYHGGDIQGIIDRLPYLKDLGITAIWMTPIYDNNNRLNERRAYGGGAITDYHGYGAVDYYGVEEHFGNLDLVRKLVDEAHRNGIKVIQDQVENHVGPYHPWVQDEPTPTWFHGTAQNHVAETWRIWTLADPYSPPSQRKVVLNGWFANVLPDMNQEDPEVARYEIQNSLWWLGAAGFDGIRQDTWPYVPRVFWNDWMTSIKQQYPQVTVVGEVFDADPALVSFFQGGKTQYDGIDDLVDSVFDFPFYYKIREAFGRQKSMTVLPNLLSHDPLYPNPERLVTFLGLHDLQRFMNEPHASIDTLKLAFTCLLTTRGIPMIYYGDEIGMAGGNDPDNRRDFPGGWKDDAANAFVAGGRTADQQQIFEHVRNLNRLRRQLDCLRHGKTVNLASTETLWAYARVAKKQMAVVILNNGNGPGQASISLSDLGITSLSRWTPQFGFAGPPVMSNGTAQATLPPHSGEIYVIDNSL
jgi:neopullulanase